MELSQTTLAALASLVSKQVTDQLEQRLADRPRLVSKAKLSELFGLSPATIDRRVQAGRFPVIRDQRRVLFDVDDVLAALKRDSQ